VRVLAGLVPAFGGEVRVAGYDPREAPVEIKRRIGYVPENAVVYDALTVAEFLLLVGRLHGIEDERIRARSEAMLEALELEGRLGSRTSSLSKGMRQKVMLAAALLHRPSILFVDEPLSGLDVASARLVKESLRRYADGGRAILYCSHVMDVVERVCDRIAVLHEGRIAAEGTFEQLAERSGERSLEDVFGKLTDSGREAGRADRWLAALEE
jgi:ABC-2 type transport system ATP-binding protein